MPRQSYYNRVNHASSFRRQSSRMKNKTQRRNRRTKQLLNNETHTAMTQLRQLNKLHRIRGSIPIRLELFVEEHQIDAPEGILHQDKNIRRLLSKNAIHWIVHNMTTTASYEDGKGLSPKYRELTSIRRYCHGDRGLYDGIINLLKVNGRNYNMHNASVEFTEIKRLARMNMGIVMRGYLSHCVYYTNGALQLSALYSWAFLKMLTRTDDLKDLVDYAVEHHEVLDPLMQDWVFLNETFSKLYYRKLYRDNMETRVARVMIPKKYKRLPEFVGPLIASYLC